MSQSSSLIPAAQYLRMSTEHQQYSLENQSDAIRLYAESHGFSVVRTYSDAAKSGLVLRHRIGLQQLLQDVVSGATECRAILVYDISRWGRFQDTDESAHYEFVCKAAGVPVHYCAESFVNDGTLSSLIMKALKRTMAGEYSRELGVKVLAGQKRLARAGFKQGGLPGYGLRRLLLSVSGEPKQLLAMGERKSLTTERVILVPGPAEEVAVVKKVYRLFLEDGFSLQAIAGELNRQEIPFGKSGWTHQTVQEILSHPKYAGYNVFGRTSQKLGTPPVRVPQSDWVLAPRAFESIVSEEVYKQATQALLNRTANKSDAEILESLRRFLVTNGKLSHRLIKNCPELPSPATYRNRFGSLSEAYRLIGYGKSSRSRANDLRRRMQAIRAAVLHDILEVFPDRVTLVRPGGGFRSYLRLKNGRIITVLIAQSTKAQVPIWQIRPIPRECQWATLLALLNEDNSSVLEMRLFRSMPRRGRFHVKESDAWLRTGVRLPTVLEFYESIRCLFKKPISKSQPGDPHD